MVKKSNSTPKEQKADEKRRVFNLGRAIMYAVFAGIGLTAFSQYASLKNSITGFRPGGGAVATSTAVIILAFLYGGFKELYSNWLDADSKIVTGDDKLTIDELAKLKSAAEHHKREEIETQQFDYIDYCPSCKWFNDPYCRMRNLNIREKPNSFNEYCNAEFYALKEEK